jgi:putative nucleotidyltransferase with HDIG domain
MGCWLSRPWLRLWASVWVLIVLGEIALGRLSRSVWPRPDVLFGFVVIAASLCVVSSGVFLVRGWRSRVPEIALLGSFFMAVSLLPLAHGLTTPGVLYGSNSATSATVLWAVPIGSLAILPSFWPRASWANRLTVHWRALVASHLALQVLVFTVALVFPGMLPVPQMGTALGYAAIVPGLVICVLVSYRHLRLAWIARNRGPLAVSFGAALLGASTLVFVAHGPWTAAFWAAHLLDVTGVFAGTILGAIVYRRSGSFSSLLAPVEVVTPLRAVELGVDPLVRRFVAALEQKHQITRDHVVRTAHMAAAVAAELHVPFEQLATITLGALLHDIGKLEVPDEILDKTGPLSADEYDIVKRHPIDGERLVLASGGLDDLAPVVRGHHERVDGAGYPDGLSGDSIALGARIVAACDAFDAMANTRQYRQGMGTEKALSILAEHAGSQWDPLVVKATTAVVRRRGQGFTRDAFSEIGREATDRGGEWCGCADALPHEVA